MLGLQVAVVDIGDDTGKIELINPVILEQRGEQIGPEGCLSFPGLYGEVERADYIKVRAQNRRGKIFLLEAEDFLARAIQHEIDHLHGVLFTSKVTRYYEADELNRFKRSGFMNDESSIYGDTGLFCAGASSSLLRTDMK